MSDILPAILSPFFSSVATIFKAGAAKTLSPLIVVAIGGLIGSVILFSIAKLLREKLTFEKIKSNWKDLLFIMALRNLLGELLFTFGLAQSEAVKAIFFTKIEPFFVLIIAWFILKEKVAGKHFLLLIIHLMGAILLSTGGNINIVSKAQIGDLMVILAMAFFALSYTFGKRLADNVGSTYSNAISMGIASILLLPFVFLFSPISMHADQSQGWLYLIIYVLLFNVISLTLWYMSLKTVKGWIVSALRYIGPVLGVPVAYILLTERLNSIQVFGAMIIITTSLLIVREHFHNKKITDNL